MKKKGNIVFDIAVFSVMLLVVLLSFYVVHNVWSSINADLLSDPDMQAGTVNETYTAVGGFANSLQYIYIFMFICMVIYLIIAAQYIQTHPGFFIIGIFGLIIMIIFAGYFANVINDFNEDASFAEQKEAFSIGSNIGLYMPLFILLIGGLVFIFLYAKFG
jgi:divalent metal cation (Fe/Co/Zn/Cd) transporter|tara:strand:+ start:2956 stop:3438 length:483 start_codon:yes stop_codon:yes gene_type:complete